MNPKTLTSPALTQLIIDTLEDNKAQDIKALDVSHLTTVTDNIIICTATSTRHGLALADKVAQAAKAHGVRPYGTEGEQPGDWVLIDFIDAVVHIMLAETRDFYSLEKLWAITETQRESQSS